MFLPFPGCPKNFVAVFGVRCYWFYWGVVAVTWKEARYQCEGVDSTLAELQTNDEREAIWKYAKGTGSLISFVHVHVSRRLLQNR